MNAIEARIFTLEKTKENILDIYLKKIKERCSKGYLSLDTNAPGGVIEILKDMKYTIFYFNNPKPYKYKITW